MLSSSRSSPFVMIQRVLPSALLGRLLHRISRSRIHWLKTALIRSFVALYHVDTAEAERPVPSGYESFNAFFTRNLRADARPLDPDSSRLLSPCDGTIQQLGDIAGTQLLQVKGITYSLSDLLGDPTAAGIYENGRFLTVYLAPYNYHRVHMPLAGTVRRMLYVPGQRWSVNARTVGAIPGLFARNERLVCHFDGTGGPFVVVLVGALNVGSISTVWAGEVLPREPRRETTWEYGPDEPGIRLARGEALGQFNIGSTVIVLLPRHSVRWHAELVAGQPVRVGRAVGELSEHVGRAS
jgi:phosphatidylserine decarboxylase